MRKILIAILTIGIIALGVRVTSMEKQITQLEKDIKEKTHNNAHRIQEFENYVDFLKREYEPYVQEQKMKNLNERL